MTHDRLDWFVRLKTLILITAFCFVGAACTTHKVLRSDFHKPAEKVERKLPAKIALLADKKTLSEPMRYQGANATQITTLHLDVTAGLMSAARTELSTLFDNVTIVKTKAQASDADYLVVVGLECKAPCSKMFWSTTVRVGLDFRDPHTGATLARFKQKEALAPISLAMGWFSVLPPFYFLMPVAGSMFVSEAQENVEKAFSSALRKISGDIRGGKLKEYVAFQARAEAAARKGEAAENAGRRRQAFAFYTQALQNAVPNTHLASRVREKYLPIVASKKRLPKVPDKAKRHMTRGQTILKNLKKKEGYAAVVAEFEQAVRAAPWWPEAYFNLALMQEKAGDPTSAMRNLKFYLTAKPRARDAVAVRRKLIELEIAVEKSQSP